MSTLSKIQSPPHASAPATPAYRLLRISCWIVALALGAAQAWATRFTMNPDGISYLDIGDAYWRGDWHNAINAYWSPLYSWILGFFLKAVKPSPYWEYPLVHLVNFLIYVAALGCFEFFIDRLIVYRKLRDKELLESGEVGLPVFYWYLLGYTLFISSSLILVGMIVTPDLCVAGFVYLASGLLLSISRQRSDWGTYLALGVVLGLAYMAKAVMFPLAFVFLAVVAFAGGPTRNSVRKTAIAMLVFLAVSAPLIAAISYREGRPTFSESGAWNYAFYVNGVGYWVAHSPYLKHPIRMLSDFPPVYEFAQPVSGTFPPWYDPVYWHEGISPRPTIKGEVRPIGLAGALYALVFLVFFLNATLGICLLYPTNETIRRSVRRLVEGWIIFVPAATTLVLYALVHVETRFIAAQSTLLLLAGYSGLTFPAGHNRDRQVQITMASVVASSAIIVAVLIWKDVKTPLQPIYSEAAIALQNTGIRANDKIGLVWNETWNTSAAEGAFVPRLLRAKIAAEVIDARDFWKADAATQSVVIAKLQGTQIRAILSYGAPAGHAGWVKLRNTEFYAYLLTGDHR